LVLTHPNAVPVLLVLILLALGQGIATATAILIELRWLRQQKRRGF
jgi:hypothetical protein